MLKGQWCSLSRNSLLFLQEGLKWLHEQERPTWTTLEDPTWSCMCSRSTMAAHWHLTPISLSRRKALTFYKSNLENCAHDNSVTATCSLFSVLELKNAIQSKYKIAIQHQVLVVNGGECMAAERRVCSYSAGTVSSDILFVCFCICFTVQFFLFVNFLTLPFSFCSGNQPHIPVQQRDDLVWQGSNDPQNNLLHWERDQSESGRVSHDASRPSHRCLSNTTCSGTFVFFNIIQVIYRISSTNSLHSLGNVWSCQQT